MKKRKLYINNVVALLYQVCLVVVGLILPRLILQTFGSEVNGLTNSVSQMLSIISLMDLGVGAVMQSVLYRPLAAGDDKQISMIYSSARRFFRTIALLFVGYVGMLSLYYGIAKAEAFSWQYTVTLIWAVAISYFAQYYFGICNVLLLTADQKIYVVSLVNLLGLIGNAVITILLIRMGQSIQMIKLASSLLYLLRPAILAWYVHRHYSITDVKAPPADTIPNKWSGLAQHVSSVVTGTVDNVVLTVFSSFSVVSVYNVYVMPLNAIKGLVESTSIGYKSFLGDLIARGDHEGLEQEFRRYETLMHFLVVLIVGTLLRVLVPFVLVYTQGITDTNYKHELFGILITAAYASYIMRLPYSTIIFAAGKFKETKKYSINECLLNIVLSVALVVRFGLCGVAVGTVVSSVYRTLASVYFLTENILRYRAVMFWKHIGVDLLGIGVSLLLTGFIPITGSSLSSWILRSALIFLIIAASSSLIFVILYRHEFWRKRRDRD